MMEYKRYSESSIQYSESRNTSAIPTSGFCILTSEFYIIYNQNLKKGTVP
jgi:hypothetical protein